VKASKQTSEQQQQMKDSPQFQPSHFTIQFHAESVCYYILHSKQASSSRSFEGVRICCRKLFRIYLISASVACLLA